MPANEQGDQLAEILANLSAGVNRIVAILARMTKVRTVLVVICGTMLILTLRNSLAAAHAARDSQELLQTVNGLLDPLGPAQAAGRAATNDRNVQVYCVVMTANGNATGPACESTLALLREKKVLPATTP